MKDYYGSNGKGTFEIETPDYFMQQIVERFGNCFDPCPIDPQFDGLEIEWPRGYQNPVYVNPPYSRGVIGQWVEKCHKEALKGSYVILLIPAYTDTSYFHDWIYTHKWVDIEFIRGRIQFKGYTSNRASFPSMLVIFKPQEKPFGIVWEATKRIQSKLF
jgi:site-specific DNA-methyltransferase (adenine-specific)